MFAHPLVCAAQLRDQLAVLGQAPLLLDVRWELGSHQGYQQYLNGHLPGAVYVDMERVLSGKPDPHGAGGRHPMPRVDDFELAMARCGVDNHRAVVCYDNAASLAAARCWWLLRHFGKTDVFVLDGGLAAWIAAGYPVAGGPVVIDEGDFEVRRGHADSLTAQQAALFARDGLLLDARPADRFRGENEGIDPVPGHIPGAVSLPTRTLLDSQGRFLPRERLRESLVAAGVNGERAVATYCGSGVQAAHLALGVSAAGLLSDIPVYVGSWSDWITDPSRPVALGA